MEENEKESSSKAARIRAARQRRYGKKNTETPTAPEDASTSDPVKTAPIEDAAAVKEEISSQNSAIPDDVGEREPGAWNNLSTPNLGTSVRPGNELEEPKKKYQGVARVRRNLIKKKRQEDSTEEVADVAVGASTTPHAGVPKSAKLNSDALKLNSLPVYMHILTVLLLFIAGFDVSFQEYGQQLEVQSSSVLLERGLQSSDMQHRSSFTLDKSAAVLLQPERTQPSDSSATLTEFHDDEIAPATYIDPIFGVDLDELTRGSGVMNQLARVAVAAHRTILWLVYYMPSTVLQTMFNVPKSLLQTPPVLCLLAVALRHLIGKGLLGAGIPASNQEDEKGNTVEVIAMARNFVRNFLATNFPTVVGLYEAFTYLRSDMYILWFGFLSGLIWCSWRTSTLGPETSTEQQFEEL